MARRFVREGACVCVSSRKESNVAKAVAELRAIASAAATTHPLGAHKGDVVLGSVCHVLNPENREALVQQVYSLPVFIPLFF